MSHTSHETIVCPNCGSIAEKNYCSECGQETHLHNDTFWGLVMHFVGHYFHYDSKFWKTLRALWFSPGKLTTAYWNKQRMRYIPPVSLYIFISAVFFLCMLFTKPSEQEVAENLKVGMEIKKADSLKRPLYYQHLNYNRNQANKFFGNNSLFKARSSLNNPVSATELIEKLLHSFPKIFFFLIPLMAGLLQLLFLKRKELNFVSHTIFSLHLHAFCFSIFLLTFLPFIDDWIEPLLFLGAFLYLVVSLKNAYNTKWMKAITYSAIIFICYSFFGIIALVIDILILTSI